MRLARSSDGGNRQRHDSPAQDGPLALMSGDLPWSDGNTMGTRRTALASGLSAPDGSAPAGLPQHVRGPARARSREAEAWPAVRLVPGRPGPAHVGVLAGVSHPLPPGPD